MITIAPVVVYDACLLYPAFLRDFLMQFALAACLTACAGEGEGSAATSALALAAKAVLRTSPAAPSLHFF